MSERFDYEQFKANAIEQLKAGVPLSGKDGALAPLLENLLNSALEGEMDSHLDGVERENGNRGNGHTRKKGQNSRGEKRLKHDRRRGGTGTGHSTRRLSGRGRRYWRTHWRTG